MRIKQTLPQPENTSLEILFLESSRPEADVSKFICDWVKLVRMCKDAHSKIFDIITKGQSVTLNRSKEGKDFLRRMGNMPVLMVQVHCCKVKIAVLDRPYCIYYRVRVLESFTIPLKPFESLEELKDFVYRWLRFREYVYNVSNQLRDLSKEKRKLALTRPKGDTDINTDPDAMSIDYNVEHFVTPSTPKHEPESSWNVSQFP
jgi:hypothetical protein